MMQAKVRKGLECWVGSYRIKRNMYLDEDELEVFVFISEEIQYL